MGRLASALASAALAAPHTYNALQQIQPQQRAPANGLLVDEGAMPRLEVSWNSPSEMCTTGAKDVNVTIADPAYRVAVNADAALNGRVVSILYGEGAWPALNATLNATACWDKVRASERAAMWRLRRVALSPLRCLAHPIILPAGAAAAAGQLQLDTMGRDLADQQWWRAAGGRRGCARRGRGECHGEDRARRGLRGAPCDGLGSLEASL